MWIQSFFKSLTSTPTRRRPIRRSSPATRLCLEPLEDRRLLSFTIGGDYPVGNGPSSVEAADLNGDGRQDLAIGVGATVSVLLANADGTFGAPQDFQTGGRSLSLAAADLNADGNIDLAMANSFSAPTVLLGNGDGTFQSPQSVPLAPPEPPPGWILTYYYAKDVAVADANADGMPDLLFSGEAWCYFEADGGELYGYAAASLGQGNGTFEPSFGDLDGWGPIAAGDLNADSMVDMVWANGVRYGWGDGTFTPRQEISPDLYGFYGIYVAVDDFNGDGNVDIAATSGGGINGGYVVLGNGNGTFQPVLSYVSAANPRALASADFNSDGKMDLVTAHTGVGDYQEVVAPSVTVCLGNGNGTFQAPLSFPACPWPYGPTAVAVGDFNGDGRTDAAVTASNSNVRVLLNDGIWTSIRISDVSVSEGNTGTRSATFTVTLAATGQTVTVAYATVNGSAVAGSDYQAKSGTLTFAPGQTSKSITVLVSGDRLPEPNETFFVNLSTPTNAFIADGQGVGIIVDDEPRISISDVTKKEGNGKKTTLFVFTVTLSATYDQAVTMSYRTVDGTAKTIDSDYVAKSGTLTFNPGETTKTITIEVKGDSKKESNESFYLDLFSISSNSWLTKNRGIGTLLNDD